MMKTIKNLTVDMPQMALGGLSESWLFKELGQEHWNLICESLGQNSFDLKNDTGDRLYATFVRVQISCKDNLHAFGENDTSVITGALTRFGNSMYFSEINLSTDTSSVSGTLMTTFSIRSSDDNSKLAKSEPNILNDKISSVIKFPDFGNKYRLMKKSLLSEIKAGDYTFQIDKNNTPLFTTVYTINPYYDINGVNLLYFASYPIINDFCESQYFSSNNSISNNWTGEYSTSFKDVFYYANCNMSDRIVYHMESIELIDENHIKISSTLIRESDSTIIAKIFSVKSRINLSN